MTVIEIEYIDHGTYIGEYGFFGKRVARSIVAGMSEAEIKDEVTEMKTILGDHVVAVEVELIGAVA